MANEYAGLSPHESFLQLEGAVHEASGITAERQAELHGALDEIGNKISGAVIFGLDGKQIRETLWHNADDEMRRLIIGGSFALAGWHPSRRNEMARDVLYFRSANEFRDYLYDESTINEATEAIVATNAEHMKIAYVPRHLLLWNGDVYERTSSEGRVRILGSLSATNFRHQMVESGDPHPVTESFRDSQPLVFKRHLLHLALQEIEKPNVPFKLQGMLFTLQREQPELFDRDLFNRILARTGKPPIETTYEEYLAQERQAAAEEKSKQEAKNRIVTGAYAEDRQLRLDFAKEYTAWALSDRSSPEPEAPEEFDITERVFHLFGQHGI